MERTGRTRPRSARLVITPGALVTLFGAIVVAILARNLMVATMVIAVGTQYAVITADDHDSSLVIVNEYDPFG